MASAPQFKVFNPLGQYVAACKHLEDAACLVAMYGTGATIRDGHTRADIVWTEGAEDQSAAESYDHVHQVATRRIEARAAQSPARRVLADFTNPEE